MPLTGPVERRCGGRSASWRRPGVAHWLTRSGDAQVSADSPNWTLTARRGPAWLPVRAEHIIATAAAVGPRGWWRVMRVEAGSRSVLWPYGTTGLTIDGSMRCSQRPATSRHPRRSSSSWSRPTTLESYPRVPAQTACELGMISRRNGMTRHRRHGIQPARDHRRAEPLHNDDPIAALVWFASDFVSQIGVSISQHLTGSPPGGSDHDRTAARQLPVPAGAAGGSCRRRRSTRSGCSWCAER